MGSCFGRCISKQSPASRLWRSAADEQEVELMSNASDGDNSTNSNNNFIFRIITFKRKQNAAQFLDKFWEHQDANYTKLNTGNNGNDSLTNIQLQNLDVHNLLHSTAYAKESALHSGRGSSAAGSCTAAAFAGTSSRASSSLDLEWEHEYVHLQRHQQLQQQQQQEAVLRRQHEQQQRAQLLQLQQQSRLQEQFLQESSNAGPQQMLQAHKHADPFASPPSTTTTAGYHNWPVHEYEDPLNSLDSMEDAPPSLSIQYNQTINAQPNGLTTRFGGSALQRQAAAVTHLPRNGSFTRTSSHNSWSHISTPESLEWDIDEEQQQQLRVEDDSLDCQTLQLLHQIEQLKNRVLNETGEGLFEMGEHVVGNGARYGMHAKSQTTVEFKDNS